METEYCASAEQAVLSEDDRSQAKETQAERMPAWRSRVASAANQYDSQCRCCWRLSLWRSRKSRQAVEGCPIGSVVCVGEAMARVQTEAAEQIALAQWLDLTGALWCHVPNGGARDTRTGAWLKKQGVKAGAPDVLIFDVPVSCPMHDIKGVAIELKTTVGRVSPIQQRWLDRLARAGWHCMVARGAMDAIVRLRGCGFGTAVKYRQKDQLDA